MAKALKIITIIYLVLAIGAILLIPASANGWFGMESDPLSAIFALFFALPWSALLYFTGGENQAMAMVIVGAGIAANTAILLWITRRLAR